jgi:hypothetical protein
MATEIENGVVTLNVPKNNDIPSLFTGVKRIKLNASFNDQLKTLYTGTFGKPSYWDKGDALTLTKDTGDVHRGTVQVSKDGIKKTLGIGSMLSDFAGAIAKFKKIGYKAVITRQ